MTCSFEVLLKRIDYLVGRNAHEMNDGVESQSRRQIQVRDGMKMI